MTTLVEKTRYFAALGTAAVTFFAWALTPSVSSATEPLFDRIEINGQSGRLSDATHGWVELPQNDSFRALARAERCTAIGGPRGKFKVSDGQLWLQGLARCSGDVALSAVYPKASSPMLATWVHGELIAELGKVLCRSQSGSPVFERVIRLTVDSGKVTAMKDHTLPRDECSRQKIKPVGSP